MIVIILDHPRHADLISEVREAGARIRLIGDGDVSAAIASTQEETGVDLLMGTGSSPEAIITEAALRYLGGEIQGKLVFRKEEEKERAAKMGITDFDRIYSHDDLASSKVMFIATGVTNGS